MAIESIGSSTVDLPAASRQASANRQAEQPPPPKPEQSVERKEEAPRPVKNAEGQTTGTRINVMV